MKKVNKMHRIITKTKAHKKSRLRQFYYFYGNVFAFKSERCVHRPPSHLPAIHLPLDLPTRWARYAAITPV